MNIKANIRQITNSHNFRHGMLYTVFSFANNGISFVLLLILAKYLIPFDYGQLNLFNTFITLLNIVISLCTAAYIQVSFFQKSREDVRKIIQIVFGTATCMLIVISIALILIPSAIEKLVGVSVEYLWLGLMICYFGVYNTANLDIWRLEEKPISYGLYSLSFALCNFTLTFWLIVGLRYGWEGRVYAWSLLGVLYFIVSLVFLIRRRYFVLTKPSWPLWKETLIYGLPLIPHLASFWMKQGLDRYIINYFYDASVVGYFSFAANLASIIVIVGSAFNSTNSVYIYKRLAEGYTKVRHVLSKQTKVMTVAFFAVACGVAIFAWGLIHFFLPKYQDSVRFIIPLCFGGFFQCIYLLWVNYLFFYKKTRQLMYITLSTALLQMPLSIWLTRYSPLFTAYISMTIMALTMTLVYLRSKKELRQQTGNNLIDQNYVGQV